MIKIVSTGGVSNGTKVYNEDGTEITDVVEIQIDKIELNSVVYATIKVVCELDIEAQAHDNRE